MVRTDDSCICTVLPPTPMQTTPAAAYTGHELAEARWMLGPVLAVHSLPRGYSNAVSLNVRSRIVIVRSTAWKLVRPFSKSL